MSGIGAVASLYLGSLFLLLIAPAWIALILLAVALVMTFVVIRQKRNRSASSPLDQSSKPTRGVSSLNGADGSIDKNDTNPIVVGCFIVVLVAFLIVGVLLIRYLLWVSSCGPGGCL